MFLPVYLDYFITSKIALVDVRVYTQRKFVFLCGYESCPRRIVSFIGMRYVYTDNVFFVAVSLVHKESSYSTSHEACTQIKCVLCGCESWPQRGILAWFT